MISENSTVSTFGQQRRIAGQRTVCGGSLVAVLTAGALVLGGGGAWASPSPITPETIPAQSDAQVVANAGEIAKQVDALSEDEQAQLIEAISAEQQEGSASEPSDGVKPQAVPVALVIGCVASVGYGVYSGYKTGDPVDFIANAVIGCVPGGAAAKPAVVKLIKANKGAIIKALKALGVSGPLITALEGDSSK